MHAPGHVLITCSAEEHVVRRILFFLLDIVSSISASLGYPVSRSFRSFLAIYLFLRNCAQKQMD
jgi:hypothetical protein